MQELKRGYTLSLFVLVLLVGCAPGTPRIDGAPGAPPSPATLWPVPAPVATPAPSPARPESPQLDDALAADSARIVDTRVFSLTDVLDLALRNAPSTRETWALARSAAESYGSARSALYPTVNASVVGTTSGTTGNNIGFASIGGIAIDSTNVGFGFGGNSRSRRSVVTPAITLSYLIFDFGGRAGTIEAAKQRAIAADLAHNSNVQNVVLQVESALFSYLATRALHEAQIETVSEAQADLRAAEERHRVGVASLQEVLQTRTAASQAQLALESLESSMLNARGSLAVTMGFPANLNFEIPNVRASDSVMSVANSVDTLISRALAVRPELLQARADARELAAQVRVARSAGYPAITLRSTSSQSAVLTGNASSGISYSLILGVQIPIFNGFSTRYDARAARDQYLAGLSRVQSTSQQITLQVFTAYNALRAATKRVETARELLAAAQQSADMALGRYRSGVGTIIDVLLGRRDLANARAESIQAQWEWRTALVQLGHDVGTLDLEGRPNLPLTNDTTRIRR